jgi:predicted regulator of Ras-like GTPase activity (Roadblock/LC7/MglB family)
VAPMDAAQALADLTEISSQIQGALLLDRGGDVLASTFEDEGRTARVAEATAALLAAVEEVSGEREEPLVQLEAATLDGSVFVVRDGELAVAATTTAEPTVGLVFYDLKSCLRAASEKEAKPRPRAKRAAEKSTAAGKSSGQA